jgi:hypothetical protein
MSGAQILINVIGWFSDPHLQALRALLQEIVAGIEKASALRNEIQQREEAVAHKEKQGAAQAEALSQRLADVVARERQATATMQSIDEKRNELEQLRNEMRSWSKAAA